MIFSIENNDFKRTARLRFRFVASCWSCGCCCYFCSGGNHWDCKWCVLVCALAASVGGLLLICCYWFHSGNLWLNVRYFTFLPFKLLQNTYWLTARRGLRENTGGGSLKTVIKTGLIFVCFEPPGLTTEEKQHVNPQVVLKRTNWFPPALACLTFINYFSPRI